MLWFVPLQVLNQPHHSETPIHTVMAQLNHESDLGYGTKRFHNYNKIYQN